MTEKQTPDEQVYQENKREPEVREVYSNADDQAGQEPEGRADQDEIVEDTFPASDPPATSSSVPKAQNES